MAKVTYKVAISGLVQGVSFRASMQDAALSFGVQGWVRNRDDGAVEALVQGEESSVNKLLDWARVGPPGARVASVERKMLDDQEELTGFRIVVPGWWEEEGEE